MKTKFVGADAFLHVEAFQRIGTQVLDDIPKGSTIFEDLALEGFPDLSRCRCPSQFSPQRKGTELIGNWTSKMGAVHAALRQLKTNKRGVQTGLPQLNEGLL